MDLFFIIERHTICRQARRSVKLALSLPICFPIAYENLLPRLNSSRRHNPAEYISFSSTYLTLCIEQLIGSLIYLAIIFKQLAGLGSTKKSPTDSKYDLSISFCWDLKSCLQPL